MFWSLSQNRQKLWVDNCSTNTDIFCFTAVRRVYSSLFCDSRCSIISLKTATVKQRVWVTWLRIITANKTLMLSGGWHRDSVRLKIWIHTSRNRPVWLKASYRQLPQGSSPRMDDKRWKRETEMCLLSAPGNRSHSQLNTISDIIITVLIRRCQSSLRNASGISSSFLLTLITLPGVELAIQGTTD